MRNDFAIANYISVAVLLMLVSITDAVSAPTVPMEKGYSRYDKSSCEKINFREILI